MTTTIFLLVLLSSFLHAGWNVAAKRVQGDMSVIWLGQVTSAIVILPFALHFGPVLPDSWITARYLVVTSLTQAAYFVLLSSAYRLGDISMVYPIARGCGVAGTTLCAATIIGESLSLEGTVGILAVCVGTVVLGLAKGGGDRSALKYAIGIGVVLAAGSVNDKYAVNAMHPVVYIFWMYTLAASVAAPILFWRSSSRIRPALKQKKREIALIGVGSTVSYLIILFVIREGPISYVVAMRELSVVLGALWGFAVLKERMNKGRLLGIASILAGLVLIRLA